MLRYNTSNCACCPFIKAMRMQLFISSEMIEKRKAADLYILPIRISNNKPILAPLLHLPIRIIFFKQICKFFNYSNP